MPLAEFRLFKKTMSRDFQPLVIFLHSLVVKGNGPPKFLDNKTLIPYYIKNIRLYTDTRVKCFPQNDVWATL